jgi:peptidyl-prolyl cis-trans isomerase SurA
MPSPYCRRLSCAFLSAFLFAVSAAPVAAQALVTAQLDRIVAVVDEDVILQSELDQAVRNVLTRFASSPEQLPPRHVLERQVLERLILLRLQVERAQSTGIRVGDSDVDQAVGMVAQQFSVSVPQLRASIEADGFTWDEYRSNLREEILLQRLRSRIVQTRVQVSDTEIDILLASDSLKRGEVRLAHILVAVPDGADADTIRIGREKAEGVRKLIDEGMEFSAAAIRYSDGQNALDGGDLGWRRFDEVPSLFADLVQGMRPGDVTQAVRGQSGFHILKVVDTRDEGRQVVREFKAAHILVRETELQTATQALARIRDLRSRVLAGEDFHAVAREHSEDETSRNLGGDLGWFQAPAFGPRIADVVTSLGDGDVSEPFRTETGWHILYREASREMDRTDDYMRMQARETIRNRKAEEEFELYLRQLRDEAFIENRLAGS